MVSSLLLALILFLNCLSLRRLDLEKARHADTFAIQLVPKELSIGILVTFILFLSVSYSFWCEFIMLYIHLYEPHSFI